MGELFWKSKTSRFVFGLTIAVIIGVTFQNCSKGFQAINASNQASSLTNCTVNPTDAACKPGPYKSLPVAEVAGPVAGQLSVSQSYFDEVTGLLVDAQGNLYISDYQGDVLRKMSPAGVTTIIAGQSEAPGLVNGTGQAASFEGPGPIVADSNGNFFLLDIDGNVIRKVSPDGVVSTLAGSGIAGSADGAGPSASFNFQLGEEYHGVGGGAIFVTLQTPALTIDANNNLYIADTGNSTIRMVTPAGVVTTIAGSAGVYGSKDGVGAAALFSSPAGIAIDANGNLYVADMGNDTIRKLTNLTNANGATVTTIAGTADKVGSTDSSANGTGPGGGALFKDPMGLAVDSAGNLYIADAYNGTIRKMTPNGTVTTLAGTAGQLGFVDGTGAAARFGIPSQITIDSKGNLYVADGGAQNTYNQNAALSSNSIRKIWPTGVVTTVNRDLNFASAGTGAAALFGNLAGIAVDSTGNIYVADSVWEVIFKITPAGVSSVFAGQIGIPGSTDGAATTAALFNSPSGIAIDANGNFFVADSGNYTIREINANGMVSTVAGKAGSAGAADGAALSGATFMDPVSLTVDGAGNIWVTDMGANSIRKISGGTVTTIAGKSGSAGFANGTGTAALFNMPSGISMNAAGNFVISDYINNAIRVMSPAGVVTTLAGAGPGAFGWQDGIGPAAEFYKPTGVSVDLKSGQTYVSEEMNAVMRSITPDGRVQTLAGTPQTIGTELNLGILDSINGVASYNGKVYMITPTAVLSVTPP